MNTPNEKLIETLFNATLLRHFGARVGLYTPTSREEYRQGYDGSLHSDADSREIFLQFKRARISKDNTRFSIDITPHQHKILKGREPNTAYYIAGVFHSYDEVRKAQRDLDTRPFDFLRYYVAIEVKCLPDKLKSLRYRRQTASIPPTSLTAEEPCDVEHRVAEHRRLWQPLENKNWMRADRLLDAFSNGYIVGRRIGSPETVCSSIGRQAARYETDVDDAQLLTSGDSEDAGSNVIRGVSVRLFDAGVAA